MSKIVYILTNQSMPDTIKIGITDNLERRMRELDKTATPLPFECYYAVEITDKSSSVTEPDEPYPTLQNFSPASLSFSSSVTNRVSKTQAGRLIFDANFDQSNFL